MIVKILGILDILSGILFWIFAFFNIIPESFAMLIALYLIAKGVGFLMSKDFLSILDIIAGFLIFLSLSVSMIEIVPILISLYLVVKGVFSLL